MRLCVLFELNVLATFLWHCYSRGRQYVALLVPGENRSPGSPFSFCWHLESRASHYCWVKGWNSVTFQVFDNHLWLVAVILHNTYVGHFITILGRLGVQKGALSYKNWRLGLDTVAQVELDKNLYWIWGIWLGFSSKTWDAMSIREIWAQGSQMDSMDPVELLEILYTILLTKFLSINSCNRGGVTCCRFLYHSILLKGKPPLLGRSYLVYL